MSYAYQDLGADWGAVVGHATGAVAQVAASYQAKRAAQEQRKLVEAQKELMAQQSMMPGAAPGGMPKWVIPAAIGGGVLVLLLVMKKRK